MYETKVNHFTSPSGGDVGSTFKMRYLINDNFFDKAKNSAILFYTGNEGNVWSYYNNTGFITDKLAPKLNALIVYGEHRYYGKSMPFGDNSF